MNKDWIFNSHWNLRLSHCYSLVNRCRCCSSSNVLLNRIQTQIVDNPKAYSEKREDGADEENAWFHNVAEVAVGSLRLLDVFIVEGSCSEQHEES